MYALLNKALTNMINITVNKH